MEAKGDLVSRWLGACPSSTDAEVGQGDSVTTLGAQAIYEVSDRQELVVVGKITRREKDTYQRLAELF